MEKQDSNPTPSEPVKDGKETTEVAKEPE